MDIKFTHISSALAKLTDELGRDGIKDLRVEVSMTEDDPGAGKMVECLTLKCSTTKSPGQYDSYKSDTSYQYTVEVFADNENRVPRLTVTSSRDLERKES